MQKVEGSSPFSRSQKSPPNRRVFFAHTARTGGDPPALPLAFGSLSQGGHRRREWGPAFGGERTGARGEAEQIFLTLRAQMARMGVQSMESWPCGRDSHPKPECHRRCIVRHEARGVGHWF